MNRLRVICTFLLLLSFSFSFSVPGNAQLTAETYCSTDEPIPIPDSDLTGITSVLNVPDLGLIDDVVVKLQIDHTFRSDLVVTLTSPDNTTIELFSDVGSNNDNFGNQCDPMPNFILDDDAQLPVADFIAANGFNNNNPVGTFRPQEPLSTFMGEDQSGQWTLSVADDFIGITGQLNCWCLEITTGAPEGCCVLGQASCLVTTEAQCSADNGSYLGDDTSCNEVLSCFQPTLEPLDATNEVFTEHTVNATYLLAGVPEEGVLVEFEIISGPNEGTVSEPGISVSTANEQVSVRSSVACTPNADCTTDSNGQVSWTYTSSLLGVDTIIASVDGTASNEARNEWILIRNIPTLSEWSMIALTLVLGASAVLYLTLRRRRQSV